MGAWDTDLDISQTVMLAFLASPASPVAPTSYGKHQLLDGFCSNQLLPPQIIIIFSQ